MIPSKPHPANVAISRGSFTAHTFTTKPAAWAARTGSRSTYVAVGWVVRYDEPTILREPHVGLDAIAPEVDRLLKSRNRVLWSVPFRATVSDATHASDLTRRELSHARRSGTRAARLLDPGEVPAALDEIDLGSTHQRRGLNACVCREWILDPVDKDRWRVEPGKVHLEGPTRGVRADRRPRLRIVFAHRDPRHRRRAGGHSEIERPDL